MPGAQVAETTYTPRGWRREPLRLIVRRVRFSAAKIANGSLTARRRKTIHPEQLALALDGQVASVSVPDELRFVVPAAHAFAGGGD